MTQNSIELHSITEAIEAIKKGEVIIVVDDADRENEGDFIAAAEKITPEMINFMATHGRGLICAPLLESRCDELGLDLMIGKNSAAFETPFTVSVDLRGKGVTTGISASDRSATVKALIDNNTKSFDLARPGHIFPLKAKEGGVLRRTGHTEAAIDFARLANLKPAGLIVEIMNEDGSMARLPQLIDVAKAKNEKDPEKIAKQQLNVPDSFEFDKEKQSFAIRAGTPTIKVIHSILRTSSYMLDQVQKFDLKRDKKEAQGYEENRKKPIQFYRIVPRVELRTGEFDTIRNCWAKKITFVIKQYDMTGKDYENLGQAGIQDYIKSYRYLYTGENTDILNFDIPTCHKRRI